MNNNETEAWSFDCDQDPKQTAHDAAMAVREVIKLKEELEMSDGQYHYIDLALAQLEKLSR